MRKMLARLGGVLLSAAALAMAGCGWGGDPSDFLLTANQANISVMADYTTPAITLTMRGVNSFGTTVALTAVPPPGFTCNPSCTATISTDGDATTTVAFRFDTVSTLAGPAVYPIVFRGVKGKIEHDVTVMAAVTAFDGVLPPPDFDFTVDPSTFNAFVTKGKFYDDIRYTFTFARYNHYTGPISVVATLMDPETFCSTAACSFVDTANVIPAPFVISTDTTQGRHTILFTASVAPYVTKTATAEIVVIVIPPLPGPPLPGGGG